MSKLLTDKGLKAQVLLVLTSYIDSPELAAHVAERIIKYIIKPQKIAQLQQIADDNYASDFGTYDFDGIASELLMRVDTNQEGE